MLPDLFYSIKPLIPRTLQIVLRRQLSRRLRRRSRDCWPIWQAAGAPPPFWRGWPGGKRFALVLTHDVETNSGASRCEELARLEEIRGFRSGFAFVPLRYPTPERLLRTLGGRGFEIMVHDLYHDGKLYRNRQFFASRTGAINQVLRKWAARGFASAAMHHNLSWISELDIDYDISTYDVDPFEPQRCGLGRIFPCWVQPPGRKAGGYVEMPYTLPQDFSLFVLMREQTDAIWRQKLDWIARNGGMALVKTHPDYMAFRREELRTDRYPVELYTGFLEYVRQRYDGCVWLAQPSEIAAYWRSLRPAAPLPQGTVLSPERLCPSCRRAEAEGWISHYRDSDGHGS